MRTPTRRLLLRVVLCVCGISLDARALADCSLTSTGVVPLSDLAGDYRGFPGGLYSGGTSIRGHRLGS